MAQTQTETPTKMKSNWLSIPKGLKHRKSSKNLSVDISIREEKPGKSRSTFTAPTSSQTSSIDTGSDNGDRPSLTSAKSHKTHKSQKSSESGSSNASSQPPVPTRTADHPLQLPVATRPPEQIQHGLPLPSPGSGSRPDPTLTNGSPPVASSMALHAESMDSRNQQAMESKPFASLLSRDSLRKILDDPVGLFKFGTFLANELGAEQLCFWLNAEQHRSDLNRLQSLSRRLHDLHVPSSAPLALNISSGERRILQQRVSAFTTLVDPFAQAREAAFAAMHGDAWPRFVKHRLSLAQNHAIRNEKRGEHIDSFCLAEVRQDKDQPIIMMSEGFVKMTGYQLEDALSKNCRFLQGPGTSKSAMARIRSACRLGLPAQELLLNYKADGAPIWVLLRIEPLRDSQGILRYLLGHQFNVSSKTSDLSYLVSDALDDAEGCSDAPLVALQQSQAEEAMKSHISTHLGSAERKAPSSRSGLVNQADRDRRMKDATDLAFAATSARPASREKRPSPPQATANGGLRPTSAAGWSKPAAMARPTSAGARKETFGASSSLAERQALGGITQIGELEGEAQWQSDALARFCFVDPATTDIMYSSPSLPVEWAQGQSVLAPLANQNADVQQRVRQAMRKTTSTRVDVQLQLTSSGMQNVTLSITPLLKKQNTVAGVVVLFGTSFVQ